MAPESPSTKTLFYKRSHFVTHLPVDYRYTPSHAWVSESNPGKLRIGVTKFATRMLGELVDHSFDDTPVGSPVEPGQIIGWVEGFKAMSDIYCVASGSFAGSNPALKERLELLGNEPFQNGWLYEVQGEEVPESMDVHAYVVLLDKTIDKILEKNPDAGSELANEG